MITDINNNEELVEVFFGTIYANIIISMVTFIVILIPFVKNLYKKILDIVKRQKVFTTILGIFIILIIVSILFNLIFYSNDLVISSSVGLILLSLYLFFLVKSIIEHNNYLNMYVKYNNSIETLKSYEAILDKYRLLNHENKNNLLTIRHMINKNNSEVSTFIDKLVKNEYQDDENLMMETSKIPSGGLRALIYSKLLYMKNNDVDFILKVDKKIRSVQLIDLNELLVLDICKIVGVFLDNAIEETKTIQNGNVSIELYMLDDRLNISIANTFEGTIDLDRMDEARYTTKGEDHGYGLSLVKEIINKNTKLENIRMINDNVFVQVLRIDM